VKLAINGLGRIGRLALRQLVAHEAIEIAAVNDLADTRTLAHLLKYDSVHGKATFPISQEGESLVLGPRRIPVFHEKNPASLPFGDLGAQVVLECKGAFTSKAGASLHRRGTVSHVLVSAPSEDMDFTVVMGVNHEQLDIKSHHIISNASCTTHCLALLLKVLDEAFGVESGLFTTVHSYTNDQRILDLPHPDLRRARAASMNMIPTSTGAAADLDRVLPHLAGKLDGLAVRVPTPDVSLTDLTVLLTRAVSSGTLQEAFRSAAHAEPLRGFLELVEDEIVSVDLTGNPASCIYDPFLAKVMTPRYVKVFGWYDNEFSYAARLVDLARHVLGKIEEAVR
jgi:glyceraldehyde 3-phosphate dehydrogenase